MELIRQAEQASQREGEAALRVKQLEDSLEGLRFALSTKDDVVAQQVGGRARACAACARAAR